MTTLHEGLGIRGVEEDEFRDYAAAVAMQFGESLSDEELPAHRARTEMDRSFACFEGDRIVGTAANITFTMGLPGAAPAACAGLTAVGVHPTRRRRGILNALMRRTLDDAVEHQEPFAALYASEATIYGRYGYGPAAPTCDYQITAPHGRLREPAGSVDEIRLVEAEEAVALLPPLHARLQQETPGLMKGADRRWDALLHDPPSWRDGATSRFHAVIEGRGAVTYRLKDAWHEGAADGTVRISELVATDSDAYLSLWQFCLTMDLMPNVRAGLRPPDEPLAHALVDPARLRARGGEPLYIRLVDLPRALTARGYGSAGTLVLDVRDGSCPWNEGRWRLDVGTDGSSCERTDAEPDLTLDTAALATVFLGGVRVRSLVDAGRVEVHRPDAPELLARIFHSDRAPWNAEMF